MPNQSKTPETDAVPIGFTNRDGFLNMRDFARKLEVERNEARNRWDADLKGLGEIIAERDHLRKVCDELAITNDSLKHWSEALKTWLQGGMEDDKLAAEIKAFAIACEQQQHKAANDYNLLPHVQQAKGTK